MNPMFSGHGLRTRRRSTIELDNDAPDVLQVSRVCAGYDLSGALRRLLYCPVRTRCGAHRLQRRREVDGGPDGERSRVRDLGHRVLRRSRRHNKSGMADRQNGHCACGGGAGGVCQPYGRGESRTGVPSAGWATRCSLANLQRAFEALPLSSASDDAKAGTLSGGQQRLLAKVLVVPPKLLVADELCLGLAPIVIDAVYNGLREINKSGTALLLVEQQVDRALELAIGTRTRPGERSRTRVRRRGLSRLLSTH